MGRNKGEERGFLDGGKTLSVSPLDWVVEKGGLRPQLWRKPPGEIAREWEGGSSRQGASTPWSGRVARGYETSRVTLDRDGILGEDGRGQGGDRNSPATRYTEASGDSSSDKEMASGLAPAPSPIPHQDTETGRGSEVSMHRHLEGVYGANPEHGALARREYSLLAPEDPAGDTAAAEPQECGDGHDFTMGTGGPDMRETETGDRNGQLALLACGSCIACRILRRQ